uniref:Ig-like domain-containing protein n=1 Tax=Scleropages formosus TaxID=113540 RepID=A0A8C9TGD8_SCLFO
TNLHRSNNETTMRRRERDTVTLHTGVTDVQKDSQILWSFGSGIEDLIAQLINGATQTDINERFGDRLELDTQTGSLTIRNLNTSDSGVYLNLSHFHLSFIFSVSNSLHPELVVSKPQTRTQQQDTEVQSSSCRLLCSVENDRDVTLSWTRGKEMLNQTSNPHLNTTLSLPLDIEEQCFNYSCVSSNPVSEESLQVNMTICWEGEKLHQGMEILHVRHCILFAQCNVHVRLLSASFWPHLYNIYDELVEGHFSCRSSVQMFHCVIVCVSGMLCAVGAQETTMRRRERDTVTLHTGVTDVQKDSQILWYSGSGIEDLIAQLINGATQTDINERFRDRLELDTQTGSLTIRNLNTSDSGVYLFSMNVIFGAHRLFFSLLLRVNSKLALIKTSTSISILNLFTK